MTGNSLPLVSVLIPAYNHEKYVQEAIQSIIDQTYRNIELIVIDDGSTDNTWQKICEIKKVCEKRFARVVFETQQNQGTCITLNKLIEHSKGEFLAIIASDDKYLPNAIELLCNYLTKHIDIGLVSGDNLIIDENSKQCYWDEKKLSFLRNFYIKKGKLYYLYRDGKYCVYLKKQAKFISMLEWITKKIGIDPNSDECGSYETLLDKGNHIPNGYLIRTSILKQIPKFTPKAPLEDLYLMLQISKVSKIKVINDKVYLYRWHLNNTLKNNTKMHYITSRTILYEKKICENETNKKWKDIFFKTRYKNLNLFNFGFIKLYRIRDLIVEKVIFQIFSYKFTIIQNSYPE